MAQGGAALVAVVGEANDGATTTGESGVAPGGKGSMKLKRAAYRHIEAEIYAYYDTLQAIRDLRANIFRD